MPRLLVVDDNALTLYFFRDALAAFGVECETAASATEAVARAAVSAFDLMLIDAHLPDMHGAQLLQRIRSGDGASRDVTALATTAALGTEAQLLAAGFTDVLTKPIGLAALHARLSPYLRVAPDDEAGAYLDARRARHALGDASLVAPLRELLSRELESVPDEFALLAARGDLVGMRERLHRLAASAGLCGAVVLGRVIDELHATLVAGPTCDAAALTGLFDACARTRAAIDRLNGARCPTPTT